MIAVDIYCSTTQDNITYHPEGDIKSRSRWS